VTLGRLAGLGVLALALGLGCAACGKKGLPGPPPGVPQTYPQSYPRE
jgi:hypothetical protein